MKYKAALTVLALAALVVVVSPALTAPEPSEVPIRWELEAQFPQAPQPIRVRMPGRKEMQTFWYMRYLVTNRRRVHTRRELLSRVWGEDYYGGARTVDVHIRRIRSKIETGGRTLIQTVRGVGYRFTG